METSYFLKFFRKYLGLILENLNRKLIFDHYFSNFPRFRSTGWHGPGEFLDKAKGLSEGRRVGGSGGGAPWTPEKFSKLYIKNSMKNYNFSAIFPNFNENCKET